MDIIFFFLSCHYFFLIPCEEAGVCVHAGESVGTVGQKNRTEQTPAHEFSVKKAIIYSRAGGITLITIGDPW